MGRRRKTDATRKPASTRVTRKGYQLPQHIRSQINSNRFAPSDEESDAPSRRLPSLAPLQWLTRPDPEIRVQEMRAAPSMR